MRYRIISSLLLLSSALTQAASTPSRAYQWGFESGNLIANWSFEQIQAAWDDYSSSGLNVDARFKNSTNTGSFVAKVSGTYAPISGLSQDQIFLNTSFLRIQGNASYTLSFYYKNSSLTGQINPVVSFRLNNNATGIISTLKGVAYSSNASWKLYVLNFTTPSDASLLQISLAECLKNTGGTYYFDDVVLEEGNFSVTEVTARRLRISESMAFGDGLGRTIQTQSKVFPLNGQYLISGAGYDNFARPETTFLATPVTMSSPTLQTSLLSKAKSYYGSSGPFDTHNFPFSQVKYADEPSPRVIESSTPDAAFQLGQHTSKQGYYFVSDTALPANIETPAVNNTLSKYRFNWSKNPDDFYALTWTNILGQTVRTATCKMPLSSENPLGPTYWSWAITEYKYDTFGHLVKTLTPIDVNAKNSNLAEIDAYNIAGQKISSMGPDRNQKLYWYNRAGQLRYSQDEVQRPFNQYTYYSYDIKGRLLSTGVQYISNISQDSVDMDVSYASTQTEMVGYIYDDTASFNARTGLDIDQVLGYWKYNVDTASLHNRLFCKYNKNPFQLSMEDVSYSPFVADFYTYDDRGRVQVAWKYNGGIMDPNKRLQDIFYGYDAQDRMTAYTNYNFANEGLPSSSQAYRYDPVGRVDSIGSSDNSQSLARYRYAPWGGLNSVLLGGGLNGDSLTQLDYYYYSQGGLSGLIATSKMKTTNKTIFQEMLGYENKAYSQSWVPALPKSRYDGTITQQVYSYSPDMNSTHPVRTMTYAYDNQSRMTQANATWSTATNALTSAGAINATQTMATNSDLTTTLNYDFNSRITGQRTAGAASADSAKYFYATNSYKLDHITGKLGSTNPRSMSAGATFVYDTDGRMIQDKSRKLTVTYDPNGMPVQFSVDSTSPNYGVNPISYNNFYDADGNLVSRVEKAGMSAVYPVRSVHFIYMGPGMIKEIWEGFNTTTLEPNAYFLFPSVMGQSSIIGKYKGSNYDFYVKDHLGSTRLTVNQNGVYNNFDRGDYDYAAYGKYSEIYHSNTGVTQKFTGKEFEQLTKLYGFGARWYDPEIGTFMSADPVGQYANPYSYTGGNPINQIDRDGRVSGPVIELPPAVAHGHTYSIYGYSGANSGASRGFISSDHGNRLPPIYINNEPVFNDPINLSDDNDVSSIETTSESDASKVVVDSKPKEPKVEAKIFETTTAHRVLVKIDKVINSPPVFMLMAVMPEIMAIRGVLAAKGVTNVIPSTFARVLEGDVTATKLGKASASDVFVTAADDIAGLSAAQLGTRLGIPGSLKFTIYEFPASMEGIASPILRTNPGFIEGGLTSGGAREFIIPNMNIPASATRTVVGGF